MEVPGRDAELCTGGVQDEQTPDNGDMTQTHNFPTHRDLGRLSPLLPARPESERESGQPDMLGPQRGLFLHKMAALCMTIAGKLQLLVRVNPEKR